MVKSVGKDPEAILKVTCSNCASRLEYTPSDVKRRDGKDISGGPDGEEYIICPDCNDRVILRSW